MARDIVGEFVRYQETGQGFHGIWADVAEIVGEFAERQLVKMGVTAGHSRAADGLAVAEVVDNTTDRLLALSAPNARGRFDPTKTRRPGMDGFRGWLWRVTRSKSVDWVRKNRPCTEQEQTEKNRRHRRRPVRKVLLDSALGYNELAGADTGSVLKQQPARFERVELLPILEECINTIDDLRLRRAVGTMLDVCTTERDMAKRLNIPVPTFHARLHRAYRVLRPMLEARGVEPSWFGA
jgi:DNA-directed RNA polymerase specialized sigma24 family protein